MSRNILAALAAVFAFGCGGEGDGPRRFEAGNFRVAIPGRVREMQEPLTSPAGPIAANLVVGRTDDGAEFNVTYSELPPSLSRDGDPELLLDVVISGGARSGHWAVLDQRPATLDGHPGREVRFECQPPDAREKQAGWMRVFVVGGRIYQLVAIGPLSRMQPGPAVAFLDSFALLSPVPTLPPRPVQPPSSPAPSAPPASLAASPPPQAPPPPERPIAAAAPGSDPVPTARPADPNGRGGAGATSGGASIVAFRWLDGDSDIVGGHHAHGQPDGRKDQHFKLELDLPPDTTIEEMTLTSGRYNRYVTKPTPRLWSIGIFQGEKVVTLEQVDQIGRFSGKPTFDLFANNGMRFDEPGTVYELEVVVRVDGRVGTLTASCRRPDPNNPELPASEGGVSIVGFRWADEAEDHVGTFFDAGRPDGQNDLHFRLEMDLPPGATIEEIVLLRIPTSRWVTSPSDQFWPVGVFRDGEAIVTADAPEVGKFGGRQAFDLFASAFGLHEARMIFDVQVTVFVDGERHKVGAQCEALRDRGL